MKKATVLLLAMVCILSHYAFRTYEASEEFLKKLGISEPMAKELIWSSFSGMYLSHPGGARLRKVPLSERGGLTVEIAKYAKEYTRTEDFKKKYLEYRENNKPTSPEKPKPMAEQMKEQKEQMEKSIKETEAAIASMPADQRAGMKEVVASLKEQLKSYDDPNNPMLNPEIDQMMKQSYDAEMAEYNNKLAQWEKKNPLTPNVMIKAWLTEFLEISKDVDFNAELVTVEDGKKLFAKTEYERKPDTWKMCFRAGKETVEAGRSYAIQWLDELKKRK